MTGRREAARGPTTARAVVQVRGMVQAVGFRWWTRAQGRQLGLSGSATNLPDGSVEVVVEGDRTACEQLLALLRSGRAPGHVDDVEVRWEAPTGARGFDLG